MTPHLSLCLHAGDRHSADPVPGVRGPRLSHGGPQLGSTFTELLKRTHLGVSALLAFDVFGCRGDSKAKGQAGFLTGGHLTGSGEGARTGMGQILVPPSV